jgi:hypothetical protein
LSPAGAGVPAVVQAVVRVRCRDEPEARRLLQALAVDDPGAADLRHDGRDIVVRAAGPSALGVLRTLDDLLGCLRAAAPEL